MRHEPPASEVTGVPGTAGPDDTTVPIRPAGPDAAPKPDHEPGRTDRQLAGRLFGAVTVVPALAAAGWLLPGLPLLLAGRLSAPPLVFMFSPLAVGLCYFATRGQPSRWPGFRGERKPVPWWAVGATVAVAGGFVVWQIAERSQQLIAVRDPAVYLQVGTWIAHHGSLPIPQSADAFGGAHPGLSFASLNYDPAGSGLAPDFMTGLPLVLAGAIWLGGVPAALVTTPLIGACAVLSFGGLAGRLVGARWAPAAAAALALSLPEQYTSRGTFSEPLAQVLLFGGLCLLIDALLVTPHRAAPPKGAAPQAAPPQGAAPQAAAPQAAPPQGAAPQGAAPQGGQDRVLAGLAGLAFGLVVLIRVDGLSDVLPAVPFLGLLLAARRRQAVPFGLGLVVGVGYGLADGYLLAGPYMAREVPSLRPLGGIAAAVVAAVLAGLLAARSRAVRAWLRDWPPVQRVTHWLPVAAAALTVAVFAGFALRPLVQNASGQYDQNSLYWVIWYIGLPAVLLGALGLAALAQRCSRALLTWQDPGAEARTWALPLLTALWVIVTVLWRPAIDPEQPWASSRLVPFVLPGLILGAVWASAWLGELAGLRGQARTTSSVVASCCAASLLIPAALTNLDLSRQLSARGMAFQRIGAGEPRTVDRLCAKLGPYASVVILDARTADQFAPVSRILCDTPTAIIDHPTTATVDAVIAGIQHAGRRPVLLAQNAAELTSYGGGPREVVDLATTQEARDLTTPPTGTWPVQYTVWISNPT